MVGKKIKLSDEETDFFEAKKMVFALFSFRRLRFTWRRWTSTLTIVFLILILASFFLLSYLPAGEKKTRSKDKSINPKFDLKSGPHAQHLKSQNLVHDYGDEYAWFIDGELGNYEPKEEPKQGRPGDNGKPFKLDSVAEVDWNEVNSLKSQYGMNIAASNRIPMDRAVPDLRLEECKHWSYTENLPSASIVIVFHNEGFSTLLRTVHSVLIRSPQKALREVLLVDDFSNKEPLKGDLDNYLMDHFGEFKTTFDPESYGDAGLNGEILGERTGKVRLVRNKERLGLINSRARGAQEAVGEVVVFLDAHCEVNYDWLPPLLAPIGRNSKTLTVPVIDGIDSETFEYRPVYSNPKQHFKGIWEWGLFYKEIEVDMKEHLKKFKVSEPYDSPTHAGGLFAVQRQFFLDIGGYDPGLLVWGGENFELSFKVWQCGGTLQWVPCSRVGHIYRPFMPYSFGKLANKRKGPLVITNYKRVIEVWFDQQYKEFFYTREPLARFYDAGDITKQLAIKDKLQCKSFDWFMNNVGAAVYKHFPKLPANVKWGEVKNVKKGQCLDTGSSSPPQTIRLSSCHGHGGNQLFRLNEEGQLGVGERCIEASRHKMTLVYCKLGTVNGPWRYDEATHHMIHSTLSLCLDYNNDDGSVQLKECNTMPTQQWIWKTLKPRV